MGETSRRTARTATVRAYPDTGSDRDMPTLADLLPVLPDEAGTPGTTTAPHRLAAVSFAHPRTPVEVRSRLALDDARRDAAYERLAATGRRVFLLSTCLRTEIAVAGGWEELRATLEVVYGDEALPATGVLRHDAALVHHLFRIAAGLASPVLGEPEVLGQFRAALEAGRTHGAVDGLFEKTLQGAVAAGRSARRRFPPAAAGSLAGVAAELVAGADPVAVFGAGAMAKAAVEVLRARPEPPHVVVYARRPRAVRFPVDEVRPLEEAPQALAGAAAVISATAAKRELFATEVLDAALARRTGDLLLVDLAMPPDFTPSPGARRLRYVGLDDLARRVRATTHAADAEAFVARAAREQWTRLVNHQDVGPVIAGILAEAQEIVAEEVRRFSGRIGGTSEQLTVVTQLASTVVNRVLHRPLHYLSSTEDGAAVAPLVAEMFGVSRGR